MSLCRNDSRSLSINLNNADIPDDLPLSVPLPSEQDVRLFFLAIQDDCERLADKLLDEFPVLVLCSYYEETPLITAIRCQHEDMAMFLLENGASVDCSKTFMQMGETPSHQPSIDWYEVSARELAYERRMLRVVEAIDYISGNYFCFLRPPPLHMAVRRSKLPRKSFTIDIPSDFFSDEFGLQQSKSPMRSPKKKGKSQKSQKGRNDRRARCAVTICESEKSHLSSLESTKSNDKRQLHNWHLDSSIIDTKGSLLRKKPYNKYEKSNQFSTTTCTLSSVSITQRSTEKNIPL